MNLIILNCLSIYRILNTIIVTTARVCFRLTKPTEALDLVSHKQTFIEFDNCYIDKIIIYP